MLEIDGELTYEVSGEVEKREYSDETRKKNVRVKKKENN